MKNISGLTIACSILLSIATALVPDALKIEKENQKKMFNRLHNITYKLINEIIKLIKIFHLISLKSIAKHGINFN